MRGSDHLTAALLHDGFAEGQTRSVDLGARWPGELFEIVYEHLCGLEVVPITRAIPAWSTPDTTRLNLFQLAEYLGIDSLTSVLAGGPRTSQMSAYMTRDPALAGRSLRGPPLVELVDHALYPLAQLVGPVPPALMTRGVCLRLRCVPIRLDNHRSALDLTVRRFVRDMGQYSRVTGVRLESSVMASVPFWHSIVPAICAAKTLPASLSIQAVGGAESVFRPFNLRSGDVPCVLSMGFSKMQGGRNSKIESTGTLDDVLGALGGHSERYSPTSSGLASFAQALREDSFLAELLVVARIAPGTETLAIDALLGLKAVTMSTYTGGLL